MFSDEPIEQEWKDWSNCIGNWIRMQGGSLPHDKYSQDRHCDPDQDGVDSQDEELIDNHHHTAVI